MKVFVTGGTGFIGSNFIQHALSDGHTIVAQRRPGSRPRIKLIQEPLWIDKSLDSDFSRELQGCDVLVHLAAHTPNPPYAPLDECIYWNVFAPVRLIQQAASQGVVKVIIAGSCFEYGLAALGQDFVHPATLPQPTLTYPISKAAATTSLLGLARHLGLYLQVLRIFQVFGEGEAATRFWPSLKSAALNGRDFEMSSGLQIRDFIPVSLVVNKFIEALNFNGVEPGMPHIRNVGTGNALSLLEFANQWWEVWKASGEIRPGKVELRPGELARLVANVDDIAIG